MYWICLSSLYSSVVIEGYVKRQTCCCSLQQPQELHINIKDIAHDQWFIF